MGDREALARLAGRICREVAELPDRTSPTDQPDQMTVSVDELAGIIERAAAGWRPPPELLAADLPSLDAEARPARFRLRVTETPPPEPGAEPQAAAPSADWLRRKIATDPDMDADAGGPPQAAASEVVAQAQRFINSFSHLAKPPQPTMSFAREVVAQHARAEAAERERDLYKASASHHAERADDNSADCARLVSEKMDQYEARLAAEAAVKRLTEAGAELHRAVMADMRGLIDPGEALAQDRRNRLWKAEAAWRAALAPGGGDGR